VTARRIADTMIVVIVLALAFDIGLKIVDGGFTADNTGDVFFVPLAVLGTALYASIGRLIVKRQPRNTIGWLLLAIPCIAALALANGSYATHALVNDPGSLPFGVLSAWLDRLAIVVTLAMFVPIFLLYPDGKLPSPRWKWVLVATIAAPLVTTVAFALTPGPLTGAFADLTGAHVLNPVGIASARKLIAALTGIGGSATFGTAVLAGVAIFVRFRHAEPEVRQQIRWLAYVAAAFFVFLITGSVLGDRIPAISNLLFSLTFAALLVGIPVACGIAILKHGLYDLEVVVKKTVVFALVAAFITVVYVLFVIAVPTLVVGFGTSSGFSPLSLLTTVVVALLFQPVRTRARRVADRIVYGSRATPYEVLSEFSERLADAYSTDDVLPRMAELVRASSGASSVRIAVLIGHELVPSAWSPGGGRRAEPFPVPPDEPPPLEERVQAFPVRHQGDLLGAIELELPANDLMTPSKRQLVQDLASQAGLVLRNVRLIEELRASRRRIVTAQDERAKKLERNIHDGAQQRLVALSVKLRLAEQLTERDPAKATEILSQLQAETLETLEELRDLARGIYPPLLADRGLPEALEAQARKSPLPVAVESDGTGRYPPELEAAVYFSCLEALQNVAKYADSSSVRLRLQDREGNLVFEVEDDGNGFDMTATRHGSGLQGMADRLEALGGTLEIRSAPGEGTTVIGRVPTGGGRTAGERTKPQPAFAASQADSSRSGPNTALGM
jgi:signal transduction histidine kinase